MTDTPLIERIERATDRPAEAFVSELPDILAAIDNRVESLVVEQPRVFARLLQRLAEIDVEQFASANPETVEHLQQVLLRGMDAVVRHSRAASEPITQDITVNFEATDAPIAGHLEVDQEHVDGGTELLADPDITVRGPANVLVSLVVGEIDPADGLMHQAFEMQGSVRKGTQLSEAMSSMTDQLAG